MTHLIYIRYWWQRHIRYFHSFQQYITRSLVIYCCHSSTYLICHCYPERNRYIYIERERYICSVFSGPMYKLLLSLTLISYVYMSFIPNITILTKYCLTLWISKLPGSFEIQWVRQYLVNITGLAGIVNATVNMIEQFSSVSGMANCPNFYHSICYYIFIIYHQW